MKQPMTFTEIALAIPEARRALAQMYIDLTLAFHATTVPLGQHPGNTDANQALVAVAVMLGHAEGRPMTASELATRIKMPRTSVLHRLDALIDAGLITQVGTQYCLTSDRAKNVPHRDTFDLILMRSLTELGPHLSKLDR